MKAGKNIKTAKRIASATLRKLQGRKKNAAKKKAAPRRRLRNYAFQVLANQGHGYRSIGAFPAATPTEAIAMAAKELKAKGRWVAGTKLITAAVPLKSAAAKAPARAANKGKASKKASKKKSPSTRRKNNDTAASDRRDFAGSFSGYKDLYFPEGTPKEGLSTLGPLVLIKTDAGLIKPVAGMAVLCQDAKGKLYIGAKTKANLIDGPATHFGHVHRVEYVCSKPHLGYPGKITWYHDFDEPLPSLKSDGAGGLHFHGGGYSIRREGITG